MAHAIPGQGQVSNGVRVKSRYLVVVKVLVYPGGQQSTPDRARCTLADGVLCLQPGQRSDK